MNFRLRLLVLLLGFAHDAASQQTPYHFDSLFKKALQFQQTGNLRQAFNLFDRIMFEAKGQNQYDPYIKSINKMAVLAETPEQQDKVISRIQEAIPIFDKQGLRNADVADLNYYGGYYYFYNLPSEIDATIQCYEKAKNIRIALFGEESNEVANCYHGLGDVYRYKKYDFLEAEKNYERALEIRERVGHTAKAILASNYYNLATTNREQFDYEKAIAYAMKAIDLVRETGDQRFLARAYSMIANIYRDMGQFAQAKDFYIRAITSHAKTKEPGTILGSYYTGLGQAFLIEQRYDDALVNFRKAGEAFKSNRTDLQYVVLLQFMADTFLETGNDQQFLTTSRELLLILDELQLVKGRPRAEAYDRIAHYFLKRNNLDSAFFYCQKSLIAGVGSFNISKTSEHPNLQQIGRDIYIRELLSFKARLLEERYRKNGIRKDLMEAVECLTLSEKLMAIGRKSLDVETSRWKFGDSNFDVYEKAISLLVELYKLVPADSLNDQLYYFFERSKAQSLTQSLKDAGLARKMQVSDSALMRLENYKKALFAFQDKLNKELEQKAPDESMVGRWRNEIVSIDRKIQSSKSRIAEKYPGYFRATDDEELPQVLDVRRFVTQENCSVIEYFWGKDNVYALGISKNEIVHRNLGRSDSILAIASSLMAHLVNETSGARREEFFTLRSNAHQLYRLLLQPFAGTTTGTGRIVIIPDGAIREIPFEVLVTREDSSRDIRYDKLKYLIHQYDISYAYSSWMLSNPGTGRGEVSSIVAMGNADSKGGQQAEIAGTGLELEMLRRRFKSARLLIGPDATEENFRKFAPTGDILHLAIHGRGDNRNSFSASLFFGTQPDSVDDGELHAYELYGLNLKARLVVLSACESGLGKAYQGEGMVSIANAFAYAGCRTTLMGLWKVPDQAEVGLMDDFYGALQRGARIDRALSDAKRNYLAQADELTADPRIWAPLVAYGDQVPVFQNHVRYYYYMIAAVLATITLFLLWQFWFRRRHVSIDNR